MPLRQPATARRHLNGNRANLYRRSIWGRVPQGASAQAMDDPATLKCFDGAMRAQVRAMERPHRGPMSD
jgi:hypothetical protein